MNNAGYTWDSVVQKMTDEQWRAIIDVHLIAPSGFLRAAQPEAPAPTAVTVPFGKEGAVVKYLLWTDKQGEILAVEKITVQLAVDPTRPEE